MTTKTTEHHLTIPAECSKKRLDQTLAELLPTYSRSQIQNWIKSGHVLLNGRAVKANTKLKGNEEILVQAQERCEEPWQAENIPLNIIHEDEDILIINKPIGLIVHPGAGAKQHTLLNALLHHHPALKKLPRAGIIHRLDKNTSGLLVIAKSERAFSSLTKQLKKRAMSREYQAIVYGRFISGGTVDAPIGRHPIERKRMAIMDNGRPAITHYRVKEKFKDHTLLHVKLETGRTHQIRVHMAHIRHPVIGDDMYGGKTKLAKGMSPALIQSIREFKHQALHAFALGFLHPGKNEAVYFQIELPDDMKELLNALRKG